jgi:alpha-tubulin suppressor-like RCC1 family protein
VQLSGSLTFTSIAAGFGDHTCGLTAAGAAYCWGGNAYGELGDGKRFDSFLPVAVSGGIVFQKLATGGSSGSGMTCGLTSAGAAYCWGHNFFGSVGDGSRTERRTPVAVVGGRQFDSISAGSLHVCARTVSGTLYCWGSGRTGQLGVNYSTISTVPLKVAGQP